MADSDREEIAKLETLFAAHPEGRIFTHLAEAYRKVGELDRAREVLNKGLERHADYSSAYVVLGRVRADQGDTGAARASFRKVLELDAHNLVALRALGDLARDAGDAEEALGYYQQLQGAEPGNEELQEQIAALTAEVTAAREEAAAEAAAAVAASKEAAAASHVEPIDLGFGGGDGAAEDEGGFLSLESPDMSTLDLSGMTFAVSEDLPVESMPHAEPEPEAAAAPDPSAPSEPATEAEFSAAPGFAAEPEFAVEPEAAAGDAGAEPVAGEAAEAGTAPESTPAAFDFRPDGGIEEEPARAGAQDDPVVVTETIADLYLQQGLRERAAEVYRRLLSERPGDAELERKLAQAEETPAVAGGDEPGAAEATAPTFEVDRNDFEIEPDVPEEPGPLLTGTDELKTEEQEQEEILATIQPDPVVASSMEGYFEELFTQIPADAPAPEAAAAPPAPPATGFLAEAERTFFMSDPEEDAAPVYGEPEVPEPAATPPSSDPWIEAAAEDEQADEPPLERIESAWTGGAGALGTEPTPYAWDARESGQEETDSEETVEDYFRTLLSWRPRTAPAREMAEAAGAEESVADEPERGFDLEDDDGEEDTASAAAFEAALISPNQPAATAAAATTDAAEPAFDAGAEAPSEPAAPAPAHEQDEIDALFSDAPPMDRPPAAVAPAPAEPSNVAAEPEQLGGVAAESAAADEEEDLEVFRAWLQSLKH